jgi:hypothetical protein
MNKSRSSSGFIPAFFSLRASSISISGKTLEFSIQHLKEQIEYKLNMITEKKKKHTKFKSSALTATSKLESFPHSHLCYMPILLTDIS